MHKSVKWKWTEQHLIAFDKVKDLFVKTSILKHPDIKKPFILRTDVSLFAVGSTLSQLDDNNKEWLITCASRVLNSAEINYCVSEKEILAIVWSLERFKTYVSEYFFCFN